MELVEFFSEETQFFIKKLWKKLRKKLQKKLKKNNFCGENNSVNRVGLVWKVYIVYI